MSEKIKNCLEKWLEIFEWFNVGRRNEKEMGEGKQPAIIINYIPKIRKMKECEKKMLKIRQEI